MDCVTYLLKRAGQKRGPQTRGKESTKEEEKEMGDLPKPRRWWHCVGKTANSHLLLEVK